MKQQNQIIKVLMARDKISEEEAIERLEIAAEEFNAGCYEDLEECLAQEFGLEPDYIFDLMEYLQ